MSAGFRFWLFREEITYNALIGFQFLQKIQVIKNENLPKLSKNLFR